MTEQVGEMIRQGGLLAVCGVLGVALRALWGRVSALEAARETRIQEHQRKIDASTEARIAELREVLAAVADNRALIEAVERLIDAVRGGGR